MWALSNLLFAVNRHPIHMYELVSPLLPLLKPGAAVLMTLKFFGALRGWGWLACMTMCRLPGSMAPIPILACPFASVIHAAVRHGCLTLQAATLPPL
jgi:hypothetical protein